MATSSAASPQPWNLERLLFYHRPVQGRSGTLYSGVSTPPPLTNPQDMGDGESLWVPVCQAPPELLLGQSSKTQDPWVAVTTGYIYSSDSEEFLHLMSVTCTAIKLRLKGQSPCVEGVGTGATEQGGWLAPPLGV